MTSFTAKSLAVLGVLTVQNAGAVLLMRAVRALPGEMGFATQTAVISQEVRSGRCCRFVVY